MGRSRGGSATWARRWRASRGLVAADEPPRAANTTNVRSWLTNVVFCAAHASGNAPSPAQTRRNLRQAEVSSCLRAASARYGVRAGWLAAANRLLAYKLDTMRVHGNDTRHQHQGDVRRVADVGTRRGVLSRGDLPSDEPWCRVDRRE